MNREFIKNESSIHKNAKEKIKEWLNIKPIEPFLDTCSHIELEYPIFRFKNGFNSWNDGTYGEYEELSYEDCIKKHKYTPIAIIDIVGFYEGTPKYAIEICYTNPVSTYKLSKLKEYGIKEVYEIDALWVLKQNSTPLKIDCKIHKFYPLPNIEFVKKDIKDFFT